MISLSDMRTRLFKLVDHVVATGEPLLIERKGVRLRLIRDDSPPIVRARLAQLTERVAVIGALRFLKPPIMEPVCDVR